MMRIILLIFLILLSEINILYTAEFEIKAKGVKVFSDFDFFKVEISENYIGDGKNLVGEIKDGSGEMKYFKNKIVVRREIYNSAKFNKKYIKYNNDDLYNDLMETSKIYIGTQTIINYYETGKVRSLLNFENNFLIFGIIFDKYGEYLYIRNGKCNFYNENLENYPKEYDFSKCITKRIIN